jgi:hypothetical protein
MSTASGRVIRSIHRALRRQAFVPFSIALLAIALVPSARAGFITPYAFQNFTLTNSTFADGSASAPDAATLILIGPNDGSGLAGSTDLTVDSVSMGSVHFDYLYTSLDLPGFDYAGFTLDGVFYQLADTSGDSGTVAFPVVLGDTFGFRVASGDNQGEPGILSITNFDVPVQAPEPGGFLLTVLGAAIFGAAKWRGRVCRVGRSRLTVMIGLAASILVAVPVFAQQVFYSGSNVTGQLVLARTVNLAQQAQVQHFASVFSVSGAEQLPKVTPKLLHPAFAKTFSAAASVNTTVPVSALAITSAGASTTGFNALSHLDQRMANNGNQFSIEPPSQSIAVFNNYVLEGVNNAVQVYTTSGSPRLGLVVSTNQLFGLDPAINRLTGANGVYLTDMRVFFDQDISRWIVLQRAQDNDILGNSLNSSHLYMAVSKTSDPTGDYYIYIMDTTNANHPGCPCVADYPQVGADQYGIHIAVNEFNANGFFFVDAAILSISKASLSSGANTPTAVEFAIPFSTGYEFALQPASTPPGGTHFLASGGLEYFTSTVANSAFGNQVAVWAMFNTSSLALNAPNPTLTRAMVFTLPYTFPDVANQRGGATPYGSSLVPTGSLAFLDGGDTRVQSLWYAAGRLYLTLQTGVNDTTGRFVDGGAYIVLSPTYRGGVLAASVLNQGYLVVNNNHLLRPSIAINAQGRGAIAVTLVGPDWHPSAAFIPIQTLGAPSVLQVAAAGTLPEDGFTGYPDGGGFGVARWGDYNTSIVTSDGAIWMVVQYIGSFPRTDFANWNTYIVRVQP